MSPQALGAVARARLPSSSGTGPSTIVLRYPRLTFTAISVALAVVLLPLLRMPSLTFELVAGLVGAAIAWRTVVIPLGLAGVPPLVDAIAGSDPLPKGGFTLLFSLWIALAFAFAALRGRLGISPRALLSVGVLASIALLGLMLIRLGISPDESFGSQKVQLYTADVLILLVAAVFVGTSESGTQRFFAVVLGRNALGATIFLLNLVSGSAHAAFNGRFSLATQEYPIDLGRASADGLLLAIYFVISATRRNIRLLAIGMAPLLAIALAAAGSRGPVVAFAVGLLALLTLTAVNRRARRRLGFVAVVFVVAAVIVPLVVPGSTLGRALSTIIGSASGLSSNGRSQLWSVAIATFARHPLLGLGTGGFGSLVTGILYPHNILLEVATELGVVGAVALLLALGDFTRATVRSWRLSVGGDRLVASILIALFLTALVNSCFSEPIQGNGEIWLWGGLALGMQARLSEPLRRPTPVAAVR